MKQRKPCIHDSLCYGTPRPFVGPIPGAQENRQAHGHVQNTVTCNVCGATRQENANGRHFEAGPWTHAAPQSQKGGAR